ncbi:MAG: hypothetical protein CMF46_02345 [Legionellales bacterium]|nr:hypothetical protein [Legionellales bacterium]|tara:strand:- start:745 stop:1119 length:375 start_codon:yes stop_codon:yes gene_type:complete
MNETEKIVNICTKIASRSGKAFSIQKGGSSTTITAEEAFAANGILPAIAKRASQLCQMAIAKDFAVTYTENKQSPVNRQVAFNPSNISPIRIMIMVDVILETIRFNPGEVVSLDEFLYEHIEIS